MWFYICAEPIGVSLTLTFWKDKVAAESPSRILVALLHLYSRAFGTLCSGRLVRGCSNGVVGAWLSLPVVALWSSTLCVLSSCLRVSAQVSTGP